MGLKNSSLRFTGYALSFVAAALTAGCSTEEPPLPLILSGGELSGRGEEIVNGFGACGSCHSLNGAPGEPLSGGKIVSDLYGELTGTNITPAKMGIGTWTEHDLFKLMRKGERPDGSFISPQIHRGYEWMSDKDLGSVIAYLRTQPAVEKEVERRDVSFLSRNTTGFWTKNPEVVGYVPSLSPRFQVEYGKYLTDHVARCGSCHSGPEGVFSSEDYLAGGQEIAFGDKVIQVPGINGSKTQGIATWSADDLRKYLQSGTAKSGKLVDPKLCPTSFYRRAPVGDTEAVVAYLRSLPEKE